MTFTTGVPGSGADLALVSSWMKSQRWYSSKGSEPRLEEIAHWELPGSEDARFVTHLLLDEASDPATLYQVPLSYRRDRLDGPGSLGASGSWWVHDGPHDPDHVAALFDLLSTGAVITGSASLVTGVRLPESPAPDASHGFRSRVLGGEQSNTSIVLEWPGLSATPVMYKLFRALHAGANPDVELQGALSLAGSDSVPRAMGHLSAEWPDTGQASGRAYGHVALAQEFLPGAEDGWRVAVATASRSIDFSERARQLGVLTASVHEVLSRSLPTRQADDLDIEGAIGSMLGRLELAVREVPELDPYRPAVEEIVRLARAASWPSQQRIHGDLHLGQVLDVPDRGWVMVDFEGEPLRPMIERSRLDSPLRDVAGMLRSFDYVAGSLRANADDDLLDWASASRASFIDGYASRAGLDLEAHRPVLAAFEIDKALYEVVYEARNRPEWLPIPIGAIARICATAET